MLTVMGVTTCFISFVFSERCWKRLSFLQIWISVFIWCWPAIVLVLGGSAAFIFNTSTSALGYWLQNLPLWSLDTGTSGGSALLQWWTIYNWTFWMAFAPVTGVFLAQLTYGHTIRESLIVNWLMPSVFATIWIFLVFGGCAINWQVNGVLDIASVISENGTYAGIWAFIGKLPFAQILIPTTLYIMLFLSLPVRTIVCLRFPLFALKTANWRWGPLDPKDSVGCSNRRISISLDGLCCRRQREWWCTLYGSSNWFCAVNLIILVIASTVNMFFVDKKASQEQE